MPTFGVEMRGYRETRTFLDDSARRAAHQAAGRSINRAMSSGRAFISSLMREDYAIKKRDLDPNIRIKEKSRLSAAGRAVLEVTGAPLSLLDFGAYQYQTVRGFKIKTYGRYWQDVKRTRGEGGVFFEIRRGEKRELKNAFIGYSRLGEPRVYSRLEDSIRARFVNAIPTFLSRGGRIERVIDHIQERMDIEFDQNFRYFLSQRR